MNKTTSLIATSAIVSLLLTITIIRGCFGGFLPSLVCGNDLNRASALQKLDQANAEIISHIQESREHSLNKNRGADKLMDGSLETDAYPGSINIDYEIKLLQDYEIKELIVHWKDYGVNANYIKKWSVTYSLDGGAWIELAGDNERPGSVTTVKELIEADRIRVTAESAGKDWIGVYEVEMIGRPI